MKSLLAIFLIILGFSIGSVAADTNTPIDNGALYTFDYGQSEVQAVSVVIEGKAALTLSQELTRMKYVVMDGEFIFKYGSAEDMKAERNTLIECDNVNSVPTCEIIVRD